MPNGKHQTIPRLLGKTYFYLLRAYKYDLSLKSVNERHNKLNHCQKKIEGYEWTVSSVDGKDISISRSRVHDSYWDQSSPGLQIKKSSANDPFTNLHINTTVSYLFSVHT